MTDPIVSAAASAIAKATDETAIEAAKVAGNLLSRLLGPSIDVVGADWAARTRERNARRILEKAEKRTGGAKRPGFTKARLVAATFDAGQYADDEIVTDYLSGVLASSRDAEGGSDDGLPWSAVIARLSTTQLRLHYLIYANARGPFAAAREEDGSPMDFYSASQQEVVFPMFDVAAALGLPKDESWTSRLSDAIDGLRREGLLGDGFQYGSKQFFEETRAKETWRVSKEAWGAPYEQALQVTLSDHGVKLFLWGVGSGTENRAVYKDLEVKLGLVEEDPSLPLLEGVALSSEYWTATSD